MSGAKAGNGTTQAPERPADSAPAAAPKAPPPAAPGVYRAMARVQAALAREGIAKGPKVQGLNYTFRGIDAVMNALAPLLVEEGLLILPRALSRVATEREAKSGAALIIVAVEVAYDFVCVADGSTHTVVMFGEAMDSSDKATNKALSASYKYACFQAFCIPTEGTPDADAETHEVAPDPRKQAQNRTEAARQERYDRPQPRQDAPAAPEEKKPETKAALLAAYDAKLAGWGFCRSGELVGAVVSALKPTFGHDPEKWGEVAWKSANESARGWIATRRPKAVNEIEKLLDATGVAYDAMLHAVGAVEGSAVTELSEQQLGKALASLRKTPGAAAVA